MQLATFEAISIINLCKKMVVFNDILLQTTISVQRRHKILLSIILQLDCRLSKV